MPDSAAARITEVPSGTLTGRPSMVSITMFSDTRAGVPRSRSRLMTVSSIAVSLWSGRVRGRGGGQPEVFRKVVQRGQHRVGRHAAQRAKRSAQHGVAQVAQQVYLLLVAGAARRDPVQRFDEIGRA